MELCHKMRYDLQKAKGKVQEMYIDFKKICKEYLKEAKKKQYEKYGFVEFQEFREIVIANIRKLDNMREELMYYKFIYQNKEMKFYHIAAEIKDVAISAIAILGFYITIDSMRGTYNEQHFLFGFALIILYCGVEISILQYSKRDYFLYEVFKSIDEKDLK